MMRTIRFQTFLSGWKNFTDKLQPTEVHAPAHISQDRFGTSHEGGNEIEEVEHFHSLPEIPKLRRLLKNQNNKGLLKETHWRSSASCRKVW